MSRDKVLLFIHNCCMDETRTENLASPSIEFDRGTLIINGLNPSMAKPIQDLIRWDERTNSWRAPAYVYSDLIKRICKLQLPLVDRVRRHQELDRLWHPVSPRSYQEAALLTWRDLGGRGIVCLPTGAGKTRLALAVAQKSGKSTLCLVPTRVLLEQWQDSIREFFPGDVGIVGDGQHSIRPITIATFESAFRKSWSFGNRFDLLIVDEAHHFGDGERDEALESCSAPFRLGLSATLDESRMNRLTQLIGPKIFEKNLRDLVGTALAEFDILRLHLRLTITESKAYHLEYAVFQKFFHAFKTQSSQSSWENFVQIAGKTTEGRTALAAHRRSKQVIAFTENKEKTLCQLLGKHAEQKTLIFTADSQTAHLISKRLLIAPITAEIGKRERERYSTAFKTGEIGSIVSCKVLNEGFNVPDAEIAIIVGGSGSNREHIQRIGRVLRPRDGKRAKIYELLAAGTSEVNLSRRRGASLDW